MYFATAPSKYSFNRIVEFLYVNNHEINKDHVSVLLGTQAHLFAFTNGVSLPVATKEHDLLESWKDLDMPTNVTTLVLTNLGTDEMSLDHLSILQRFTKTKKALIVIEIG